MPTPAERLALLMEVHGDSYRSVAERCGLDHTTVMRVARGETENPATLAVIANEGYGVPVSWLRGERDLVCDFSFAVLLLPLRERVGFLWDRERRLAYALAFVHQYDPDRFTTDNLADILQVPKAQVVGILETGHGRIQISKLDQLAVATRLPAEWIQTGLVGREDEEQMLTGLAEWALSSLAQKVGLEVTEEEIHEAAVALL